VVDSPACTTIVAIAVSPMTIARLMNTSDRLGSVDGVVREMAAAMRNADPQLSRENPLSAFCVHSRTCKVRFVVENEAVARRVLRRVAREETLERGARARSAAVFEPRRSSEQVSDRVPDR